MSAIEVEHRYNAYNVSLAILTEWLNGGGALPVTWATLTTAIFNAGQGALARQISRGCSNTNTQ